MKAIVIILLTLFIAGCSSSTPSEKVYPKSTEKVYPKNTEPSSAEPTKKHTAAVTPPKRSFNPKEVQADNYTSEYMYPSNKVQPNPVKKEEKEKQSIADNMMTKEECIAMIGEEKFEKYTEMFSNEAGAIKRCTLLKAMQNH